MLIDLPDLHPKAIGALVNGVHYTREQYEGVRARARLIDELRAEIVTREIMAAKSPDPVDRQGNVHVARLLHQALAVIEANSLMTAVVTRPKKKKAAALARTTKKNAKGKG